MARANPAGKSWGAWLQRQLDARGWRQVDLIKASGDVLVAQTVSKWLQGLFAPDPDTIVVVAATLGVSAAEAMRAAGYVRTAALVEDRPLQLDGVTPAPMDEGVRRILALEGISDERRARMIDRYRRRLALILEDIELAAAEMRDGEDSLA